MYTNGSASWGMVYILWWWHICHTKECEKSGNATHDDNFGMWPLRHCPNKTKASNTWNWEQTERAKETNGEASDRIAGLCVKQNCCQRTVCRPLPHRMIMACGQYWTKLRQPRTAQATRALAVATTTTAAQRAHVPSKYNPTECY